MADFQVFLSSFILFPKSRETCHSHFPLLRFLRTFVLFSFVPPFSLFRRFLHSFFISTLLSFLSSLIILVVILSSFLAFPSFVLCFLVPIYLFYFLFSFFFFISFFLSSSLTCIHFSSVTFFLRYFSSFFFFSFTSLPFFLLKLLKC